MKQKTTTNDFDGSFLLQRLKLDDAIAFAKIVNHFTVELGHKAFKLTKCKDDAEDLLQDVFADLWHRRHVIEISSSLSAYLYVSLKNRFLRKVLRSNLQDKALTYLGDRVTVLEHSVSDLFEVTEIQTTISSVIHKMPIYMQQIFALRGEDYSIKDIANTLGLAEQTVKTYNMQLKQRIKQAIVARHPEVSHSLLVCFVLNTLIN